MGEAEHVVRTTAGLERHIGRINAARRASAVLEAVRAYLSSWPSERSARRRRWSKMTSRGLSKMTVRRLSPGGRTTRSMAAGRR